MINQIAFLLLFLFSSATICAQRALQDFNQITAGQHIHLVLTSGDENALSTEFSDIDEDELIIDQRGRHLRIYLRQAKYLEKSRKVKDRGYKYRKGVYGNGKVTINLTFKELRKMVIKGEQEVAINGPVFSKRFRLKMYGEPEVAIDEMFVERLVTTAYGECDLHIKGGHADVQRYRLFGESDLNTEAMKTEFTRITSFGDSHLTLNTDDIGVTAFGEIDISHVGSLRHHGLVIGEKQYQRID